MPQSLSEATKSIVRATVPAIAAHGTQITAAMYERLFKNDEVRALFNQSNQGGDGRQTRALAQAILAYAQNIDNLAVLGPAVERIAHKHASLHILPEHYPHVANALLGAIKDVLGDAATDDVLNAWGEAYWFLAHILIGREAELYHALTSTPGGWTGWRAFQVTGKVEESSVITSFVLRPADGGAVARHKPGQYLTLRVPAASGALVQRNYSISSAPNGKSYRISVKREQHGLVSNFLHDHITVGSALEVGPPSGDFFVADTPQRPLVLLSGGVGLTPMVSILETLAGAAQTVPIHYVHGAIDGSKHAMGKLVKALTEASGHLKSTVFYESPRSVDQKGLHYDHEGFITVDWLKANTPLKESDVYLCGPRPFLSHFVGQLAAAGVARDQIHYEFFGPADAL